MRVYVADLEANGFLETATIVHCGVFKNRATGEVIKFRPSQIQSMLRFLDTVDVLIIHNGIGYDLPLLKQLHNYEYKGKIVDTLLMSRLLNPKRVLPPSCPNRKAGPHSIEAWGWRVGRGKPEHDDWENFSEDMLHRCTEDVEILDLVYDVLLAEANGANWKSAFLLTFDLFKNIHKQEKYGWLIDKAHLERHIERLQKRIDNIDKFITPQLPDVLEIHETKLKGEYNYIKKPFLKSGAYSQSVSEWISNSYPGDNLPTVSGSFSRISFRKVNLDSNEETKEFLLKLGWEPFEWNENDDGERTSPKLSKDDPFEGLEGKLGQHIARRVQCRQRKSIIEGLVKLIRPDGRIGSAINTLAVTGRATHRNIVNIPKASSFYGKQMRQAFSSREGYVLVGTDSDSCQLRMLAGRMGSAAYINAIVNGDKKLGTDNHTLTANIGELESRDIAKNTMYCLLFGGGDAKLAKTAKKPVGSGASLRARLYRGLDGLGELVEALTKEWRSTAKQRFNAKFNRMEYYNGYIIGLDGRKIFIPYEHQLLVYILQSDEAIMMTKAYNLAWERLSAKYTYGEDFGIVCFYHDEFTVECKLEIAQDVKVITEQAIADAGKFFNIKCPHKGDAKIGRNWYDIH